MRTEVEPPATPAAGGTSVGEGRTCVGSPTGVPGRRWVRAALGYLAATYLAVGAWAALLPRSFYDGFPGGGRQWIAGDGPFNEHLTSDTGAGFLAVGVVALLAAIWLERRLVQAASVAVVLHAAVHLAFHLRHPHPALGPLDVAMSSGGLALGALVAGAVLVAVRTGRTGGPARPEGGGRNHIGATGGDAVARPSVTHPRER